MSRWVLRLEDGLSPSNPPRKVSSDPCSLPVWDRIQIFHVSKEILSRAMAFGLTNALEDPEKISWREVPR